MRKDWRADIKGIDNLYDVDPREIMVFLRHQYLDSAKDFSKSDDIGEASFGLECCEVAEHLEAAIEEQFPSVEMLSKLEPA